jgi:arylsulfatase A-like enzyme
MDTHYPYLPQKEEQQGLRMEVISRAENLKINQAIRENIPVSNEILKKAKMLYAASVRQVDKKIGELLRFLNEKNLYDSSLIILTADHGEEFMEHGDLQHQSKLYDELLHVPLLIKQPHQKVQYLNQNLISLLQLAPTILSESGCKNPFTYNSIFAGINHTVPSIIFAAASFKNKNSTPVGRDMSRLNFMPKRFVARNKTHKVIVETGGEETGLNLLTDPSERVNAGVTDNAFVELKNALIEYIKSIEKFQINTSAQQIRKRLEL